jgi:hypothetical protein
MFLLKKFLTAWLLPPGLFVALLLLGAIFSRKRKALHERLGILFYQTNFWRRNPSNGEGKS